MRRTLFIVAAVVVVAGVLIPAAMPMRQERSWVEAVGGSMKRETVSEFGRGSGEMVEPSALEERLRGAGIVWRPDWRFLHNVQLNGSGRAVGYGCSPAPAIYRIRSLLGDFARVSTEQELREFVRVMESGSEEEQEAAVDAAGEAGLRALAARPGG